ncbi:polysaccharide biosynthesis tyrosine autokinase [Nocardioides alkalitolerans]|uniref:polysaccharide biosynthesis tyrosine autokinase n=1 Tax=Nocardioides alkalitolerans TaxID=281714 RepID=UPI00040330D0|nr:polysaccharide biosynthesis tyrosine autokinase [Nocardioides alkalitolerans]
MSLSDYLRALRNHWVGAVVLTLVCLSGALAYSLSQPAVYAANANGFVTADTGSSEGGGGAGLGSVADSLAKSRAKSYVDVAQSRAVADRVIDELDLDVSPNGLIGQIDVVVPVDTVLLKVTARASTPELAQQLADTWVTALAAEIDAIENPNGQEVAALGVRPVEAAALPSTPISPVPLRDGALGLLVGLLLGVSYAALRSQLDRKLRSSAEIEKKFGVSVVGAIPATKGLERARDEPAVLAVSDQAEGQSFIAAEAFRKLRTNLSYMDIDNPPRIIVVTSSQQSDGKSTISTNISAAIAMSGQPVILVDADLRRPVVATTLGLVEGAGLTDVLIGRVDLDDVLQEHPDVPNLSVLAAGGVPPNPSEMLGSQTMRALLERMSKDAMVVLDAPPLLPVTDAAVLTTLADGALVVVSHGTTVDTELESSLGNLASVKGRVLGVVFNRVPRRNSAGGYYGGYYYREDDAKGKKKGRGAKAAAGRAVAAGDEQTRPAETGRGGARRAEPRSDRGTTSRR